MTLFTAQKKISAARIGSESVPQSIRLADSQRDISDECGGADLVTAYFEHTEEECMAGNDPWSVTYATCARIIGVSVQDNTGTGYIKRDDLADNIGWAIVIQIEDAQSEEVR